MKRDMGSTLISMTVNLQHVNLKASEKLDYITYLSTGYVTFLKKGRMQKRYLEMLLEYLHDYTDRVKPVQDQKELLGKIQTKFKSGITVPFPGWPKETKQCPDPHWSPS